MYYNWYHWQAKISLNDITSDGDVPHSCDPNTFAATRPMLNLGDKNRSKPATLTRRKPENLMIQTNYAVDKNEQTFMEKEGIGY